MITEERTLPHNLEAEQAVLGSMLIERPAVEKAIEILKPSDFYREAHSRIFEAIQAISARDMPVDLITVPDELTDRNELGNVGGFLYLQQLMDAPSTAANIETYCRMVEEKAILRKMLDAGSRIQGLAYSDFESIDEAVDNAERIIFEIGQRRMGQSFHHIAPILHEEYERIEARYENPDSSPGRKTPFTGINWMTGGLQANDLIIIAARPSMGKTALAVQIAQYVGLHENVPIALFSLEMSKEQLVSRMIGSESRVDMSKMNKGQLYSGDFKRMADTCSRLERAPIYIDDTPDVSAMEIRAKCRRLKAEHGLGLVVIDYLQLMRSHKKTENRNQEISEISRACKSMARELKVPVIVLSQLSRAVESRVDKRPMLSDLRESGAIEAEADLVMFIYRESYYKMKESAERSGDEHTSSPSEMENAEIIIAKQRSGPTGRITLGFTPSFVRFDNIDNIHTTRVNEPKPVSELSKITDTDPLRLKQVAHTAVDNFFEESVK